MTRFLFLIGVFSIQTRIFSAYIKEIEDKPAPTPWGSKMPLGQVMIEFTNSPVGGGWVHAVAFSPNGSKLFWIGHDSSISVVDSADLNVKTLRTEHLPFLACAWLSETEIVVAGHGCYPLLYTIGGDGMPVFVKKLDSSQKKEVIGTS
jgi:actin related protein 2/3 complex subunit 1A/1B